MVTFGLPVFNGEQFLEDAIASLRNQTYDDFEIIISDNASTDRTREISQRLASEDDRIRYIRQTHNLGAAPNFNSIVAEARGKYFKWMASDDLIDPRFLECCVPLLENDPDCVLACSDVLEIDPDETVLNRVPPTEGATSRNTVERFGARLPMRHCYEVFGLYRTSVLRKTGLIPGASHGDGVLLCEMALHGPFCTSPDALISIRKHEGQSTNLHKDRVAYAEWFDARNKGRTVLPFTRMYREYARVILRSPAGIAEKARCTRLLWAQIGARRDALRRELKRLVRGAVPRTRA